MDRGDWLGLGTILAMAAFIGVCVWAWSGKRQQQFDEAEKKIHFNRFKLGENRKYRTGREWKNEWSRLFTGRDAKLSQARDRYQHGFDYAGPAAARASGTASSSLPSGSSEMAPVNAPVDVPVGPLEQQVQRP